MQFKYLFSPIKIGNVIIDNRIVSTAHLTNLADSGGKPSKEFIKYHSERAKGGVGLIIPECISVSPYSMPTGKFLKGYEEKNIPHFEEFTTEIHKFGSKIFAQIWHCGRQSDGTTSTLPVLSASPIPCPVYQEIPKEMELEDIKSVIKSFTITAVNMKKSGFDGVEIHAAHGYLLQQFLSPYSNLRKDIYGGSLENRFRIILEVVDSVREATGKDYVVGIRISGDEFVPNGLVIEDLKKVCKIFEESKKIDYISVSQGNYTTSYAIFPPMDFPLGCFTYLAAGIKEVTSLPVITAGRINDPQLAENILAENQADLVAMTRANICDPEISNKAREGRLDEIRNCIGCNQGCIGRIARDVHISCIQNPLAGRETKLSISQIERKKQVIIIGGGPAGLMAASTAAERGHKVFIFERKGELGGQVLTLAKAPFRNEFGDVVRHLKIKIEKLNVEINLNTEVNIQNIKELNPDTIIVATGAFPRVNTLPPWPPVQFANNVNKITIEDLLEEKTDIGNEVIIFTEELGFRWLYGAEFLLDKKKKVTVISPRLFPGFPSISVNFVFASLQRVVQKGLKFLNLTTVLSVEKNCVRGMNIFSYEMTEMSCDTFILSLAREADDKLYKSLKTEFKIENGTQKIEHITQNIEYKAQEVENILSSFKNSKPEIYAIGDCVAPRTIEQAIIDGFRIGNTV